MNTGASAATIAMMVVLTGTFAILAYTLYWAFSNIRPARRRAHMEGRAAAPYWHSPTGIQDERGIVTTTTGPDE